MQWLEAIVFSNHRPDVVTIGFDGGIASVPEVPFKMPMHFSFAVQSKGVLSDL